MLLYNGFFDFVPTDVDNMRFVIEDFERSDTSSGRLWSVPDQNETLELDRVMFDVSLGKKKDSFFKIADKHFFLTRTHLVYRNDYGLSSFRGSIEINWSRVSFEPVEMKIVSDQGYSYKMSIARNKRFTELYFRDQETALQLKRLVRPWCISCGFYEDFEVIRKLGSGAFASVSFKTSSGGEFDIYSVWAFRQK